MTESSIDPSIPTFWCPSLGRKLELISFFFMGNRTLTFILTHQFLPLRWYLRCYWNSTYRLPPLKVWNFLCITEAFRNGNVDFDMWETMILFLFLNHCCEVSCSVAVWREGGSAGYSVVTSRLTHHLRDSKCASCGWAWRMALLQSFSWSLNSHSRMFFYLLEEMRTF